ncbi:hypothetical protein FOC1_g10014234 [Fusarium oxysporum f. sp. cubense race 1]|uniref:Uncharacterized protein n=1 Tax=Fusarium oxysporum f. sp. cubense (strain race 1) TaxID=1229664 RepID=N4UEL3_FUSC1|nr:hypothetical protein FOC1_g10014234 [Fusarium oxysporum f. sp. cubense race 1]
MDTAEGRSVTESSEQQIKNIQSRHEDTPPVSQVPEVQNPVEASSSVPAEGNTGKTAKKPFFKRTWSKATERLFRRNTGNEERRFFIHNFLELQRAMLSLLEVSNTVPWEIVSPFDTSVTTLLFQHSNVPNPEPPANRSPEEANRYRRAIDAPEIAILPSQQEKGNLPPGPSTEMRENRNQAETKKEKTVEFPSAVGNVDDQDQITPAEASTSKNKTNSTVTDVTVPQPPVQKTASESEPGFIDKKTNVGPRGDMAEEEPEKLVTLPDPPKDVPKKSAKETESKAEGKRKVAQPTAS